MRNRNPSSSRHSRWYASQRLRRAGSSRRWRSASEILELALIMPILIPLTFGTIEFGYFFYLQHNIQAAAREGARAGVVENATDADAIAKANAFLTNAAIPKINQYTITADASGGPGSTVTCTVQATWGNVGFHLLFIPSNKVLRGSAYMVKEGNLAP